MTFNNVNDPVKNRRIPTRLSKLFNRGRFSISFRVSYAFIGHFAVRRWTEVRNEAVRTIDKIVARVPRSKEAEQEVRPNRPRNYHNSFHGRNFDGGSFLRFHGHAAA